MSRPVRLRAPIVAVLAGAACAAHAVAQPVSFVDPVPYCHSVGTIDQPDGRYTGPKVPAWMARALRQALHAPEATPITHFQHAVWRCAGGRVLACDIGANIPCDEKADQSRKPPQGARGFCGQQPGADIVPSVAFSQPSLYLWRCDGTEPVIVRQVLQVDAQGYPARYWHVVTP